MELSSANLVTVAGIAMPGSVMELTSSALTEDQPPPPVSDENRAASFVGKVISDRYRIDQLIGLGGMGAVYRGEQIHLRKRVAIKLLHPETEKFPDLVERFEREAVAGAHVQHPNVASAIDFGRLEDRSYFLILEFIEGGRLSELIAQGPVPAERALKIARQMAAALEAVHQKGIVHRDVKPQNTLLDPQDHVKIIDFGLAKVRVDLLSTGTRAAKPANALTAAGVIFGTPAYIAPEAVLGMEAVDARGDLYALGVTLYEMLSGRLPIDGSDAVSVLRRQRLEDAQPIAVRAPGVVVPPEAERIAIKLIQRNPADRYQSASEVLAAIDEAIAAIGRAPATFERAPAAPAPDNLWVPRARPVKRPFPVIVAAIAVGVLAVVAGFFFARRGAAPSPGASASAAAPASAAILGDVSPASSSAAPGAVTSAGAQSAAAPGVTPGEVDGIDAAGWRARLRKAADTKKWIEGAKAFQALATIDPALLRDEGTRAAVVAVAAGIAFEKNSELADQVFDLLARGLGSDGLDALYEIVRSRGGTKAGQRARALLTQPEIRDRASPALKIAFDFHEGTCSDKRSLLDRAAQDGDGRTLVQMEIARGTRCSNKKDPCCFRDDPAMGDAIAKVKARLGT